MYLTLSVSCHKLLPFDLFSVFVFLFFSHDSCPTVWVSSPHLCIFQAAFDESHWYSLRHTQKTSNTVVMWQRQNPSSYSLIILVRWQIITNISENHRQVGLRHTHRVAVARRYPAISWLHGTVVHIWEIDPVMECALSGRRPSPGRRISIAGAASPGASRGAYPATRS